MVTPPDEMKTTGAPSRGRLDTVRDMTEVLTLMCARLYGKRSARSLPSMADLHGEHEVQS